jgi:NADP-dependent 3-hydroxy acid dehydrogenase YdfG
MKKTWMITGTSTGFGRSLATYLAQQPDINLVATARHTADLTYLDQYNRGQILKQPLDVTQPEQIERAVGSAMEQFQRVDVLVNNAGIGYFGSFEESDLLDAKQVFDVNVWGLVNMTRAVLPVMRHQGAGTIVNFSSIGGLYSFPTLAFYHGSKYAVEGISETIAKEVQDLGIKVMLVEPSGFRTDWAGRSSHKTLPTHSDYAPLKQFIEDNEKEAHHEPGDPDRAARIIYDQVVNHQATLPLRLPLGKFAVDTAIEKYSQMEQLFQANYDLSVSADQREK